MLSAILPSEVTLLKNGLDATDLRGTGSFEEN